MSIWHFRLQQMRHTVSVVIVSVILESGETAAAVPKNDPAGALPRIEETLRRAGASPEALDYFEKQANAASAADLASFEADLAREPANSLADFVKYLLPGPDSLPQTGVPKGKTFEFTLERSRVFPGSTHKITVYVPAEYAADKPACVYVSLYELTFEEPVVFDNLINKKEMPVTIAIGIAPGMTESASPPSDTRDNFSIEFDGLGEDLARFVLEEVLPEVERHKTPDGLPIRLSTDPNDRAAGGASSRGIAAFTLAWEHPDAFRRIFTAIGTFVGKRGGDHYPVLIRKTEPKPIRIFMQDGSNDASNEFGDWWMSNQTMERALEFAGYQVRYGWGEGSHTFNHATAIFPDVMRWLWKDWPQPVRAGESRNRLLKTILRPDEDWQRVPGEYQAEDFLAVDPQGAVVFYDKRGGKTRKIINGRLVDLTPLDSSYSALAFDSIGRAYGVRGDKVIASAPNGGSSVIASGLPARNLVVTHEGRVYLTVTRSGKQGGEVWLIQPNGKSARLDSRLSHPTGVALSPDGLWLAVALNQARWGYSYRVEQDGTVRDKQRFYSLEAPDTDQGIEVGNWVMDREGRLYAATSLGVQILDNVNSITNGGCVRAILTTPGGAVKALAFGGGAFDTLFAVSADHAIYRRRLKISGMPPWDVPIAAPNPH
jgi:gluconolactonase